jgi:hypothetical protein
MCSALQTMLIPLMTNQLAPSVEAVLPFPITTWMETLKGAQDRKMFLEVACEVRVAFGSHA